MTSPTARPVGFVTLIDVPDVEGAKVQPTTLIATDHLQQGGRDDRADGVRWVR